MGHDDHLWRWLVFVGKHRRDAQRGAGQDLQHALGDLLDVVLALAQVGVFDLVELRREFIDLRHQRPFGVVVARADDVQRRFRDHRVGQDQRMHVDEGAQFGRGILRQAGPEFLQIVVDGGDRILQAPHLGLDLFFRDQVMLDVECGRREQVRAADRDAARNRNAVKEKGSHGRIR